jgi:hypothetical protein
MISSEYKIEENFFKCLQLSKAHRWTYRPLLMRILKVKQSLYGPGQAPKGPGGWKANLSVVNYKTW